jgi:CheY-like chemotaxis protein
VVPRGAVAAEGAMRSRAGKRKILLVDDSVTTLFMEKVILRNGPYELLTASDGVEAVEKASTEHPDLILMDVVMPRMTGFQACKALRERADTSAIPIILVTTRGEGENVETGFASGCTDYVTKPIDAVELLAKVKDQLGA